MMSTRIVAMFAAFSFMAGSAGAGQRAMPLRGTPPERLMEIAKVRGRIPVILGVSDPEWQPEGVLPPQQIAMQRARGKQRKEALLEDYPSVQRVDGRDYQSIPALLVSVTEGALRQLIDDDRVASLEEDLEGVVALNNSTEKIGARRAHVQQYVGTNQMIVVIDHGVDANHPFVAGRVRQEDAACFSGVKLTGAGDAAGTYDPACPNGQTTQYGTGAGAPCTLGAYATDPFHQCNHGTHVAGVAAGGTAVFNQTVLSGVATGAEIIPIQISSKICGTSGCQSRFLKSSLIQALDDVTVRLIPLHRCRIAAVNISLAFVLAGGAGTSRSTCDASNVLFRDAVANVRSHGVAVVVATGNNGLTGEVTLPACLSGVIAVSATDDDDTVGSYANTAGFIDLFAPGGAVGSELGIVTSQNSGCTQPACAPYVETFGTSMAAPHVAGAIALLRQRNPSASVDEILGLLVATGTPIAGARAFGKRRINVDLAIAQLTQLAAGPTGLSVTFTGSAAQITWNPTANVKHYEVWRNSGSGFILLGATTNTVYVDPSVPAASALLYKTRAISNCDIASAFSGSDATITHVFEDETITAGVTSIKGVHILELRQAADSLRALIGLGSTTWTDATPAIVKAIHVEELRTAINGARDAIGLAPQSFTDSPLVSGATSPKGVHITELRAAMR